MLTSPLDGIYPGPTYIIPRGTETVIRFWNKGTENSTVHLHGSNSHSVWDGWANDEIPVNTYKDYYYPNDETARSMWYHDHIHGQTTKHAYYGQTGMYITTDPAEDSLALPKGNYDVPLAISDKIYQSNGDLASPLGNRLNFFGDIIDVNGQPWPFLDVEPRKYRFRIFDMSISRTYDLSLATDNGNTIPFQVIASDSGLFASPVTTSNVLIAMGERYEIVVDFSGYAGQTITVKNSAQPPVVAPLPNTDKIMQFKVGSTVFDATNNGPVPSSLNSKIQYPTQKTTVDRTFSFQFAGPNAGAKSWTINGATFDDVNNRILARPPQGTVELWELRHTGGPGVHPVHIHLVNFQIISRTGGRSLAPYETAGLKDIVLLQPGETVRVLAVYGPWNGMYMFHCHNLIHEDNMMLDAFNVTKLEALGYQFNSTQVFGDPVDAKFAAKPYNAADFSSDAETSAVVSLANLNAYAPYTQLVAAQSEYYKTAGAAATPAARAINGLPVIPREAIPTRAPVAWQA